MVSKIATLLLALGGFAFAACSSAGASEPPHSSFTPLTAPAEEPAQATTEAAPTAALAVATRVASATGIPAVDQVVDAVAERDAKKLAALLHFWPRPCTEQKGIGAIPCPKGAPVGTPVAVAGSGSCDGSAFLQPGDPSIASVIQTFLDRATGLYAVVTSPTFRSERAIPGTYQVVFEPGVAISVDEQGITYLIFGCGQASGAALVATHRFGANPVYLVKP